MSKPFNLEAARRGDAVRTASGKSVRILAFNAINIQPLVVLVKENDADCDSCGTEEVYLYSNDGKFFSPNHKKLVPLMANRPCTLDLEMA